MKNQTPKRSPVEYHRDKSQNYGSKYNHQYLTLDESKPILEEVKALNSPNFDQYIYAIANLKVCIKTKKSDGKIWYMVGYDDDDGFKSLFKVLPKQELNKFETFEF
jgi:hypothetical protein